MTMLTLAILLQSAVCGQSDSSFQIAIENQWTAPYYVIVQVVNDSTGASREVCTEAPSLLEAVHIERRIGFNERGYYRVLMIVLNTKDRVFHFSNPKALESIPVPYSEELLAATRKWVAGLAVGDLVTDLGKPYLPVYNYYRARKGNEYLAYKLALAHVLVERGFSVRRGCYISDLIVESK